MIQSPIHKALLTFQRCDLRYLLMGGQACILYGGAEFSRDIDITISTEPEGLTAFREALAELKAETIFVPPLDATVLQRGHACHFRCHTPDTEGLRIDVMAVLRGCPPFAELWERRTVIDLPEVGEIGLLSLPDLVRAKKTQRDKDWPMIRRLLEADIQNFRRDPDAEQPLFWLRECRTPGLLIDLAKAYESICTQVPERSAILNAALQGEAASLTTLLAEEEQGEREADRAYWTPLTEELRDMRRSRGGQ